MIALKLNFSNQLNNWLPKLIGTLWCILGIVIVMEVWMLTDIRNLNQQILYKEIKAENLLSHKNEVSADNVAFPEEGKLIEIKKRIKMTNLLTNYKGRPISSLLSKLENLLPDDAYIVDIVYKKKKGEVSLVAESANVKTLMLFLEELENDEYFSKVILVRQVHKKTHQKDNKQFELKLVEAY